MAVECWIERKSHYQATGMVSGGRMTDAEIMNSGGVMVDRNRSFDSEADFIAWAKKDAGIS